MTYHLWIISIIFVEINIYNLSSPVLDVGTGWCCSAPKAQKNFAPDLPPNYHQRIDLKTCSSRSIAVDSPGHEGVGGLYPKKILLKIFGGAFQISGGGIPPPGNPSG